MRSALPSLPRDSQDSDRSRSKTRGRRRSRSRSAGRSVSKERRSGKKTASKLRFFPKDEVTFALVSNQDCHGTLLIDNTSTTDTYAFRIKTTAPDVYFVRPPMGLVPAGSKVTIVFVVMASSVPKILNRRDEAIDAGRPVPFDRLLVMAALVDKTHDFSTANEPKELSALWSTTRWKRKTTYNKFAARCFPKVVVSSDSDDDDVVVPIGSRGGGGGGGAIIEHLDVTMMTEVGDEKWRDRRLPKRQNSSLMTPIQWDDADTDNSSSGSDDRVGSRSPTPLAFKLDRGLRGEMVMSPIDSDPSLLAIAQLRRRSTSNLSTSGASCDADDEQDATDGDLLLTSVDGSTGGSGSSAVARAWGSPMLKPIDIETNLKHRTRRTTEQRRESNDDTGAKDDLHLTNFGSPQTPRKLEPLSHNHVVTSSSLLKNEFSVKNIRQQMEQLRDLNRKLDPALSSSKTQERAERLAEKREQQVILRRTNMLRKRPATAGRKRHPNFDLDPDRHKIGDRLQRLLDRKGRKSGRSSSGDGFDEDLTVTVNQETKQSRGETETSNTLEYLVEHSNAEMGDVSHRSGNGRRSKKEERRKKKKKKRSKHHHSTKVDVQPLTSQQQHQRPASAPTSIDISSAGKQHGIGDALSWSGTRALTHPGPTAEIGGTPPPLPTETDTTNQNNFSISHNQIPTTAASPNVCPPSSSTAMDTSIERATNEDVERLRERAIRLTGNMSGLAYDSSSHDDVVQVDNKVTTKSMDIEVGKEERKEEGNRERKEEEQDNKEEPRENTSSVHITPSAPIPLDMDGSPQMTVDLLESSVEQLKYAVSKAWPIVGDGEKSIINTTTTTPTKHSRTTRALLLTWLNTARQYKRAIAAPVTTNNTNAIIINTTDTTDISNATNDTTIATNDVVTRRGAIEKTFSQLSIVPRSMFLADRLEIAERLRPISGMLDRCVSLSKMHARVTSSLLKSEEDLQRTLIRLSAPICASPWGIASHAARKLVEEKRREADKVRREQTVSVLASLRRVQETQARLAIIRARLLELEPNVAPSDSSSRRISKRCLVIDVSAKMVSIVGGGGQSLLSLTRHCAEKPMWNMEWECGRLAAEKEFLAYCCDNDDEKDKSDRCETSSKEWYVWAEWGGRVPSVSLPNPVIRLGNSTPRITTPRITTPRSTTPRTPPSSSAKNIFFGDTRLSVTTEITDLTDDLYIQREWASTAGSGSGSSSHASLNGPMTPRRSNTPRRPDSRSMYRKIEVESPHGVKRFFSDDPVQPNSDDNTATATTNAHGVASLTATAVVGAIPTVIENDTSLMKSTTSMSHHTQNIYNNDPHAANDEGKEEEHGYMTTVSTSSDSALKDVYTSGANVPSWEMEDEADVAFEQLPVDHPKDDDETGYAHGYWYQVNRRYHDVRFFRKFVWWRQRQSSLSLSLSAVASSMPALSRNSTRDIDVELLSPQSRQQAEKQRISEHEQEQQLTPKSAWHDEGDGSSVQEGQDSNGMVLDALGLANEEDYIHDFSLYATPMVELVVRALADYERRDESELSMREGELIHVVRKDASGWWEGRREGEDEVGWFPSSYGEAYHEIWSIEEELIEQEEDNAF